MRKQPGIEKNAATTTEVLTVLSVSPLDEDHLSLQAVADHSPWVVLNAQTLVSALALLLQHDVAVVLCERELLPGTYIDLLEYIIVKPNAPSLIVASRLADERLWAEALNLGAWDVLAKPFDRGEVLRSVESGWQHWHDQGALQTNRAEQRAAVAFFERVVNCWIFLAATTNIGFDGRQEPAEIVTETDFVDHAEAPRCWFLIQ